MRKFFLTLLTFFLYFLSPAIIHAQSDFLINRDVRYQVTIGTDIEVTELITITNQKTEIYPQVYQLKIQTDKVKDFAVFQDETNQVLDYRQTQEVDHQLINIPLPPTVGRDASQTLLIVYKLTNSVIRQGEVTEINLPELTSAPGEPPPRVVLELPPEYSSPAYLSPPASTVTQETDKVTYEFTNGTNHAIKAVFGSHQLYQFTIFYHLNPTDARQGRYHLTFPPDTPYQRIALTQFSQTPDRITTDKDGNWIAQYPQTTTNSPVVISGVAMVFSRPIIPVNSLPDSKIHTQTHGFWQTNSQLTAQARELGSAEKIYQYVTNHLSYDYAKQGTQDNRQGALKAYQQPTHANCMEFTDLFIAMTRAANIPSRRVVGYANSANSNLQPIGLQGDILHAWAEYYDANTGVWRPVDPTWAHTSDGLDYFSSWDLQHLTLAINGHDDNAPPPPGHLQVSNQTKNVIVVPANSFPDFKPVLEFSARPTFYFVPFIKPRLSIEITNQGNISAPQLEITDNLTQDPILILDQQSLYIPPLGSSRVTTRIANNSWFIPTQLDVVVNGQPQTIPISSNYRYIQLTVYLVSIILYGTTCFLTFRLTRKAWRVPVQKRTSRNSLRR